ncbi:hypothetical protein YIM_01760 [Amycolatopsis sp. YIM 10]|nr:hypothetical protein YIM_01760 [Amycolatopsis sp. YIM 10]
MLVTVIAGQCRNQVESPVHPVGVWQKSQLSGRAQLVIP